MSMGGYELIDESTQTGGGTLNQKCTGTTG